MTLLILYFIGQIIYLLYTIANNDHVILYFKTRKKYDKSLAQYEVLKIICESLFWPAIVTFRIIAFILNKYILEFLMWLSIKIFRKEKVIENCEDWRGGE